MKKLIKMYNEKYGNTLGVIDDDFNKEQMYRIYYFIKNNCDDKDIQARLEKIKLDKPKTLEQQLTKLESENGNSNDSNIKKYVDDNAVILPLPIHTTLESSSVAMNIVNIMDLIPGVQYSTHNNPNETKRQGYKVVYICDDGNFKTICSMPLPNKVVHLVKVLHYTNYSILSVNNTVYEVDYSKHSILTDIQITKTLQNYIPITNTIEYSPTNDYHPATKKYVDDRFICSDSMENVGTIPKEEMQKCNNGTSRYVSSINLKEFFADYKYCVYQGTYGDKSIRMKYDPQYNRILAYDLDIIDTYDITLAFEFNNNYMYPFNGGASQVKSYQFTNDLVITKSSILNPSEVLTKNNTQEYTPTENYHPTTKKYVDDTIKTDLGTTQLTTTAKDVKGAINEVNSQYKDMANQLKSIKVFETFPNDTILESLPVDSTFEVKGFYSTGDMQKCLYRKTTKYVSNSIPKANSTYYIKPITSNENIVFLPHYGIRAGKEYSLQNSNVLSNITLKHGTVLKLPVGDYYFENSIDLKTKQLSLIGECMSFTPDSNTNGITRLIFNNLQDGQTAITIGTGSLFNVCILGNDKHYDYTIDRSKTYIDKTNIEKEVSTIKNYGIKGGSITTINNVVVQNFYYGCYLDTGNIYIDNFFARKCHIGLSIGGDTKCKGVYGWNIHTLLQIRNSISSAIQVRADSCHHLVHLIGYSSSIHLADLDGDYCLGSLLKIGNAGEWGSVQHLTVNGIHGRACCLNVYNTETDTAPTSSNVTEAEVSNYGFISIEKNNKLDGAIITLNTNINDNPLDGASNYLTPQILIASAGVCYAMFNTTFLSTYGEDGSIIITKQKLLDSMALLGQSANNTRISMNTNSGTYYINKVNPTDIKVSKQTVENLE